MKKIPNWVSIQQSVQEANHFTTYKSKHELVDWLYATGRLIISIGWHCQYVDAAPKWAVTTGSKKNSTGSFDGRLEVDFPFAFI